MKLFNKTTRKLVTHDGSFHTDDVFAAATISLLLDAKGEAYEITRTRDEKIISNADYVFDVGSVHDPEKNKFDHHQVGGAGKRPARNASSIADAGGENGIEYASFGLVWKKFALELCGGQEEADMIDKKLAAPIDAWDNGLALVENKFPDASPYFLQHIFFALEPTWREDSVSHDEMFLKAVHLAREILAREIIQAKDAVIAEERVVDAYNKSADKRIIILDKNYPCQHTLNSFPEPMFVIYPRKTNNYWGVKTIRQDPKTFNSRKDLPASWKGLRDSELAKVTGVEDAVFCHKGLFMAVAKTKEGAIKLAQAALNS